MSDRNAPRKIDQRQQSRRIDTEDKLVDYIRTMLGEPMITVDVSNDQIRLLIDDTVRKFSDFAYGGEQRIGFVVEGKDGIQDYRLDNRVQAILSVSLGNSLGSIASSGASGISLGAFGTVGIGYVPHITLQGEVSTLQGGNALAGGSGVAGGVAGGPASGQSYGMSAMVNAFVLRTTMDTMRWMNARGVNFEYNANTKILRVFENITGPFLIEAAVEYIPDPDFDEIYSHPWIKDYALAKVKFLWGTITGKYTQTLVGGSEINYADMKSEAEGDMEKLDEDLLNKYSEALGVFSG